MRLDPHDLPLFYTLHKALMFFVNQRLDVIQKPLDSPDQVGKLRPVTDPSSDRVIILKMR